MHICHISVLNPLRHSRIYYRWSLASQDLGHKLSIIAQGKERGMSEHGIELLGTGNFHRLSAKRFLFPQTIRQAALDTRADAYVLHSPELLGLGKWLKEKTGARLVYDLHEDYKANILHATHYARWLRKPLAAWVRQKEMTALSFLDAIVYAEESYQGMLEMEEGKTFILRNKFTPRAISESTLILPEQPYMLYTGTLAWPWGIRETYDCWKAIRNIHPLRLVIAGFDASGEVVEELHKWIGEDGLEGEVDLIGGKTYVSYSDIVALIGGCFCGTAFYHLQPNIVGKVPTKFYEYMAIGRPLLFTREKEWIELNGRHPFGIDISLGQWEDRAFVKKMWEKLENWESSNLPVASYDFRGEVPELKLLLERLSH